MQIQMHRQTSALCSTTEDLKGIGCYCFGEASNVGLAKRCAVLAVVSVVVVAGLAAGLAIALLTLSIFFRNAICGVEAEWASAPRFKCCSIRPRRCREKPAATGVSNASLASVRLESTCADSVGTACVLPWFRINVFSRAMSTYVHRLVVPRVARAYMCGMCIEFSRLGMRRTQQFMNASPSHVMILVAL